MIISIIIPCRNEAAHIERCVQSVLAQQVDTDELEVILADGLSDDGFPIGMEQFWSLRNRAARWSQRS